MITSVLTDVRVLEGYMDSRLVILVVNVKVIGETGPDEISDEAVREGAVLLATLAAWTEPLILLAGLSTSDETVRVVEGANKERILTVGQR